MGGRRQRHRCEVGHLAGNGQTLALGGAHDVGRIRELGHPVFEVMMLGHLRGQARLDIGQTDLFLRHVSLGAGHQQQTAEHQGDDDDQRRP